MKKRKVKITKTGYLPDSPDRFNDMNIIPSNRITMKNVKFPILGTDNFGNQQMMMPGGEYTFPGQFVTEIPMGKYQNGGPKEKGWREYKTPTGQSLYLDPRFKNQRYYVDEKGDHMTPDQNMSLFDVQDNIWESGTSMAPLVIDTKREDEAARRAKFEQDLIDQQGTLKPATEGFERLKNQFIYAMDQPLDALGSLIQRGYIPEGNLNGNYPTSSPMSDVIGAFNPVSMVMDVGRVGRDLGEKETYTTWGGAGELGLNAAGFLPFGSIAKKVSKTIPDKVYNNSNIKDFFIENKIGRSLDEIDLENLDNLERKKVSIDRVPESGYSQSFTRADQQKALDEAAEFDKLWTYNQTGLDDYTTRVKPQIDEISKARSKADSGFATNIDNIDDQLESISEQLKDPNNFERFESLSDEFFKLQDDRKKLESDWVTAHDADLTKIKELENSASIYDPDFERKVLDIKKANNDVDVNKLDNILPTDDRNKLVYMNENDPSFQNLDISDKNELRGSAGKIGGVRTSQSTITLGSTNFPTVTTHLAEEKLPWSWSNPLNTKTKKSLVDLEQNMLVNPTEVGGVGIHEINHDRQLINNWIDAVQHYDPNYGYYVNHDKNDLAKTFKNIMVEPTAPVNGKSTYETWLSGLGELHSELGKARLKTAKAMMKDHGMSMEEAVKVLKQDRDDFTDYLIEEGNLNKHFKPETSLAEKRAAIKILPVAVPAIGAGYVGSKMYNKQDEEDKQFYKQGGIYLGKYEFKDGGLVKAADGIETNFRRTSVDKSKVLSLQKELKNTGYDLGKSGKNKDGVDGVWGPKTEKAYRDYIAKQSRQSVQTDSSATDPFVEEDSLDFTQQIVESDSTKHNKALPNSLPQQAQQKNIQVVDVPDYPQSGLAVEEGFQPTEAEDKYAYGIKNPDYNIPPNTLDPSQFYYESKRGVLDLPDGSKQAFMEIVPSQPIMGAMPGSVTYNPKEKETQAITEGAVAPLEYVLQKNAPNLYREDGTACMINGKTEDRCAAGYQLGLDMNFGDKINRKDLGMSGDSWEVGQNIIDKGGSRVYGLTNDLDINPTDYNNKTVKNLLDQEKKKRKVDAKKITNDAQVGDVVEMWYKDSGSQDEALSNSKGNTLTTHSGLVSEKDGVKYVTHNIHGTWHTDKLEDVINGKRKYMASGIVRPNYKVDENALGVKVSDKPRYFKSDDKERGQLHEGSEWSAKQTSKGYFSDKSTVVPAKSTEANNYVQGLAYYAPQVQQDFKLSDNEMEQLMKISFGVYGKESGFSHGSEYTNKRSIRKLAKAYKDIAPDWAGGDELSSGPTQIKLDTNFNTDAEKALLAKYGINDKNIWDEKTASGATLLEMARNYERFKQVFGVGFDNADPITMRNVLALAHNKGIDNVLKNEFTDISEAEKRNLFERAYDYATTDTTWEESKLKGTKRRDYTTLKKGLGKYADLHKDRKSYSNTVQDYSESLDVDYNKVKSNYWNAKTKERNPEEQYDVTDWTNPSFIYDEEIEPIIDKASEQINAGERYIKRGMRAADRKIERGLKALEKKTRSGVKTIKKKIRMQEGGIYMGTFEFKDGALVKAQKGLNKRMVRQYPGMKSVYGDRGENLNIIKDKNFIPSEYGYGDIEFIYPGSGLVTYNDEYAYQSPTPDKYTAVYNPKGANKHDVFLDMMHGMRHDPDYMELLNEFSQATRNARGADMDYFFDQDAQQDPNFVIDGREQWDNNYIDGMVRAHMYKKASQEKRLPFVNPFGSKPHGTEDYEMELEPNSPEMYQAADQIYNYIKGDKNRSLKKVKIKSLPRNTR